MSAPVQMSFEELSRASARTCAQAGIAALARAFNHCDEGGVAYRYSDAVQSRFFELATELVQLIESGDIEGNSAHGLHLRAEAARGDRALQDMIRKVSRKTPIRGK